jgi:hypothetical protein
MHETYIYIYMRSVGKMKRCLTLKSEAYTVAAGFNMFKVSLYLRENII